MRTSNETQKLDLLNIPYDSKFFLIKEINANRLELTDVYQISANTSKIYSLYAVWENEVLKPVKKNHFWDRTDLKGHKLRAGNFNKRYVRILLYLYILNIYFKLSITFRLSFTILLL